jgi:hypothetical protein
MCDLHTSNALAALTHFCPIIFKILNYDFEEKKFLKIQYLPSQFFGDLKKLWDENFNISKNIKLGPLYAMVKEYDHGNVKSLQNTSKGCPMVIQKSFMCEPSL